jgi:hypothetical protein
MAHNNTHAAGFAATDLAANIHSNYPMNDPELCEYSRRGATEFMPMLCGDSTQAGEHISKYHGVDPLGKSWQRTAATDKALFWTEFNNSEFCRDRPDEKASQAVDIIKPLRPVLNSLPIGKIEASWPWKTYRTVNPYVWRQGPNVYVRVRDERVLIVNNNALDGVIIIHNQDSHNIPSNQATIRPLSSIIYRQWIHMHRKDRRPRPEISSDLTAGRKFVLQSPIAIQTDLEHRMRSWLNYVIVFNVKEHADVNLVLRCLQSRKHPDKWIPFWQGRETFQAGDW